MKSLLGDLSFENLFRRFIHFKICSRRFFLLWRCVHEDLSFEDLFKRFFLLWRCVHGDFSFYEDVFMEFCPFKIEVKEIYTFSKICSWRFVLWRFIQETFPFKILFWRYILWRFRRFILWKNVRRFVL